MQDGTALLKGLTQIGRPRPLRRWCRNLVVLFDILILLTPFAAFTVRMELGHADRPLLWFAVLVATVLVLASVGATLLLMLQRGDPLEAAREADRMGGRDELFLTAADYVLGGRRARMLPLLLERASAELSTAAAATRPALPVPFVAVKRDLVALALTLLILMVPAFSQGIFGPADSSERPVESGGDSEADTTDVQGGGEADVAGFEGKVRMSVRSDQKLYLLGDEITLIIDIEALEPLPADVGLDGMAIVDGEVSMPLPVPRDVVLPTEAGERVTVRMAIRDHLKAVDRYRRGLLAIDPLFSARSERDDLEGQAAGNRVVLQIAENAEKLRAKTPTSVKKKQQQQKKKKKPKPPQNKKKKDAEKKPRDQKKKPQNTPGRAPGGQAPEKLDASPFVVEPLFAGDQTSKRKVRVFDRKKEKGTPPPARKSPAGLKTRGYDQVVEAELKKLELGGEERRLVRKYLEGIRDRGGKGTSGK